MAYWCEILMGGLIALTIGLLIKIYLLRKSAREIHQEFSARIAVEQANALQGETHLAQTNTLISISSRDKAMRELAGAINVQLDQLKAQRQRYERGDMELKNAISSISHDLRTPLTAICGYLELMEQEDLPEKSRGYLRIIEERTEVMRNLTDQLFTYTLLSQKNKGKGHGLRDDESCIPLYLGAELEKAVGAYYGALKAAGIAPEIFIPEKKIRCLAQPDALSRVFANLITNAIKYSDGDLKIVVLDTGKVQFSNRASGLDQVQVAKLFDRFYTVETGRVSAGLGLSIARILVEEMGGFMTAWYREGRLTVEVGVRKVEEKE